MKFDSNNFIVDEIYTIRFCGKCPSCHKEYDSVEDEHGVITSPHFVLIVDLIFVSIMKKLSFNLLGNM